MPEPAQDHGQHQVAVGVPSAPPVPAERDVEVVAQPGRQGYVPAVPELLRVRCEIGLGKVPHQPEPQHLGHAAGDVGIAREVTVDLDRKEPGGDDDLGPGCVRIAIDRIHPGRDRIGDDDLLDQPDQAQHGPPADGVPVQLSGLGDFGQQVAGAFDRPSHQLREKGHEQREIQKVAAGLQITAIDVDRVAEGLEGIEGNPHGQDDAQHDRIRRKTNGIRKGNKAVDEEAQVFEDAKQPEVGQQRNAQQQLAPAGVVFRPHPCPDQVVHQRREGDEPQEAPVPGPVKDVGGHQQHAVLRPMRQNRIKRKDTGKEDPELELAEKHACTPRFLTSFLCSLTNCLGETMTDYSPRPSPIGGVPTAPVNLCAIDSPRTPMRP